MTEKEGNKMDIRNTTAKFNSYQGLHETKWQKKTGGHVFARVQRFGDGKPRAGVSIGDMDVDEVRALAEFLTETVAPMMEQMKTDRQYHAKKVLAQIAESNAT